MGGDKFQRQVFSFFLLFSLSLSDVAFFQRGESYAVSLNIYLELFFLVMNCKALNIFLQYSEGWEVINSRDS